MKESLKVFVLMLVLLLVASLGVFPVVSADKPVVGDKYVEFIEKVLTVDTSKYDINLKVNSTMSEIPMTTAKRDINDLMYELKTEDSNLRITFAIDRGIIFWCKFTAIQGKFVVINQCSDPLDAAKGFIERYQAYTKIETTHLIPMLDNIDITKDSTTIIENTKLVVKQSYSEGNIVSFKWIHTVNGADYYSFQLQFDKQGNFISMIDSRKVFTLGDTSINVSKEQAIGIALENLQFYSYEMPDGSVVSDFSVDVGGIVAFLLVDPVDYVLNPYWRIELPLDRVYPGSVHGITVIIWANTGVIHLFGNAAFGGVDFPSDDANISDVAPFDNGVAPFDDGFVFVGVVGVVVLVLVVGLVVKRKRK